MEKASMILYACGDCDPGVGENLGWPVRPGMRGTLRLKLADASSCHAHASGAGIGDGADSRRRILEFTSGTV